MNSKRKADLQRRLSLAPVPRPPADLADRIKSDIPEYLRPEADRKRLSRSVAFNMRVAASILVVISSVIAAIYLLGPEDAMMQMSPRPQPAAVADHKTAAPTDEVEVEIAEAAPAPDVVRLADAASAPEPVVGGRDVEPAVSRRREDDSADEALVAETLAAGAVVGGIVASNAVAAAPPPTAAAVPEPVAPAAPAPKEISVTAEAPRFEERAAARMVVSPSLAREAHAADLDLGPASSVFGISIDPGVFHRIKETLERNQRPTASAVNVEAIINYFASAPVKPSPRQLRFEVEGSPSPVIGVGHSGYLRFTIDTPAAASHLPVASNVKLEIEFNSKVVESATPVGDFTTDAPEAALLHNLSVTGLYDVSLKPSAKTTERVATVRLSYTAVGGSNRHTMQQAVYVRDFARLWTHASRRHRVASLGAVWAESLKVAWPQEPDVARRAEELATQNPRDARAQELATAATASEKLPSGGF